MVATGTHREPTQDELKRIFGDLRPHLFAKTTIHKARESHFTYYGKTSRGTPVRFNKMLGWADGVIPIGSVEPHYFAGLTGGRKSFLPGISAYETVEANHEFALEPEAATFRLKGNPVHEDMVEAAEFLDADGIWSVQTVVDPKGRPCFASAGHLFGSFEQAAKIAMKNYGIPIKHRYDVVVAIVNPPLSHTLYQAQKGLENASLAVRKGGRIIWVADCKDGIGKERFFNLLKEGGSPEGTFKLIRKGYKLGYQKAAKIAQHSQEAKIHILSSLSDKQVRTVFAKPVKKLDQALSGLEDPQNVLVMPDAPLAVPLLGR